jgi:hypothetical protein
MAQSKTMRQIWLDGDRFREAHLIGDAEYAAELQQFRESLLTSCPEWPCEYNRVASPLPVVVPETFTNHCERLGDILCRAVTSIVERWWIDSKANFAERMPILPYQEEVLRVSLN